MNKEPRNFQIVRKLKALCEEAKVRPENCAVDVSGSPAFGDIVVQVWSPNVYRMQFGGKASDRLIGEDRRPAHELFVNRVSEVWYQGRDYMRAGQIIGMPDVLAKEICLRQYRSHKKSGAGLAKEVERKRDMIGRLNQSPDLADAFFAVLDLLIARKGWKSAAPRPVVETRHAGWVKEMKKLNTPKPRALTWNSAAPRPRFTLGSRLKLIR